MARLCDIIDDVELFKQWGQRCSFESLFTLTCLNRFYHSMLNRIKLFSHFSVYSTQDEIYYQFPYFDRTTCQLYILLRKHSFIDCLRITVEYKSIFTTLISCLICSNANFNKRDRYDKTAFMYACQYNYKDIVETLLQHNIKYYQLIRECHNIFGASRSFKNIDKIEHLHYIDLKTGLKRFPHFKFKSHFLKRKILFEKQHRALYEYNSKLIPKEYVISALKYAVTEGHFSLVEKLLAHEKYYYFFLDAKDKLGLTLLIYAAWKGYTKTVDILLKYKANPNLRNRFGETALMLACQLGYFRTVKKLYYAGANLCPIDHKGENAAYKAAKHKQTKIICWLKRQERNKTKKKKRVQMIDRIFIE